MRHTLYVGMNAHAASIPRAVWRPGAAQVEEWQLENKPRGVGALRSGGGPLVDQGLDEALGLSIVLRPAGAAPNLPDALRHTGLRQR